MGDTFKPVPQPRLEIPARTERHKFSQQKLSNVPVDFLFFNFLFLKKVSRKIPSIAKL